MVVRASGSLVSATSAPYRAGTIRRAATGATDAGVLRWGRGSQISSRSGGTRHRGGAGSRRRVDPVTTVHERRLPGDRGARLRRPSLGGALPAARLRRCGPRGGGGAADRKSTRLNSSHVAISYAVF